MAEDEYVVDGALDISLSESAVGVCSICNVAFSSYTEYVQHAAENHPVSQAQLLEEKKFTCEICQKTFKQQSNLIQHRRVHTNERPYPCKHCDKSFKQKSQVMQHERLHTGEKPYKCLVCERAFPQAGQLFSHKKTHGVDPYVEPQRNSGRGRKRNNPDLSSTEPSPAKSRLVSRGRGRPKKSSDVAAKSLGRSLRVGSCDDPMTSRQARSSRASGRMPSVREVTGRSRHAATSSAVFTKGSLTAHDPVFESLPESSVSAPFNHVYVNKPRLIVLESELLESEDSEEMF